MWELLSRPPKHTVFSLKHNLFFFLGLSGYIRSHRWKKERKKERDDRRIQIEGNRESKKEIEKAKEGQSPLKMTLESIYS